MSSWDGFWLLAKVFEVARVSGGVSCHPGKRKGLGISAEWLELDQNLPRCSLISQTEQKEAPSFFPRALGKAYTRQGQRLPGINKISQNADFSLFNLCGGLN